MKKIILTILIGLAWMPFLASADIYTDAHDFVYTFYLRYDNGKLSVDKSAKHPYDLIADTFEQPEVGENPFHVQVFGVNGDKIAEALFKIPTSSMPRGPVIVRAPYFANAGKVVFLNSKGVQLLTVSVAESSFCNDDKVCNADVGEDWKNCRNDCVQPAVTLPSASPSATPVPQEQGSNFMQIVVLAVFAIIGVVVGYLFFHSRRDTPPPAEL